MDQATEPPTLDVLEYMKAKRLVLESEIRAFVAERNFDELEDAFYSYGLALQRHPDASL